MSLLGTKISFSFLRCVSDWPPSSFQNDDLTGIFCKTFSPILFNNFQSIIVVRKVREVFVEGHLKNINLLQFCKINPGLVTIVFEKQWLKHEFLQKNFLLVVFSSFHLFVLLTVLLSHWINSLLVKLFSSLFTILLPLYLLLLFTFDCSCNFVLTFTLTFT